MGSKEQILLVARPLTCYEVFRAYKCHLIALSRHENALFNCTITPIPKALLICPVLILHCPTDKIYTIPILSLGDHLWTSERILGTEH